MATPTPIKAKEIEAGTRLLAKAITSKPIEQLTCRAMRHAWVRKGSVVFTKASTKRGLPTVRIVWECTRGCGVERHDVLIVKETSGGSYTIVDRRPGTYVYPEDYPIPGVPRGVQPSVVYWQEYIRRANQEIAKASKRDREQSA